VKHPGLVSYPCFIHGREDGLESAQWLPLLDPSTGEAFAQIPVASETLVDAAVDSAQRALGPWRDLSGAERAARLHALADGLRQEEQSFAALLMRESGKTWAAAVNEVTSAAALLDYFTEEGRRLSGHIPLLGHPRQQVLIVREPVGVVVAVTPFNYPLSTLIAKLAPALAVGCTVVAKPDEHTPLTTIKLAQLGLEKGLLPGAFNVVTGTGPETGSRLVNHPLPRLITFTGSTAVGKIIQTASAAFVRKTILELGGHCPAIISADADWQAVLPQIVGQIFKHSGQYCYRISRLLVADSLFQEVLKSLVKAATRLKVGPADDASTDLGPLNHADILRQVAAQVEEAVAEGARVLLGGSPVTIPGYEGGFYYPPTILADVRDDMAIMREEVFGPVVMVQSYADTDQALELANATPYGLAGYIFSGNVGDALEWAGRLECGSIWINHIHQAVPEAPFGGMKESGLGREKSRFGIEEYTELKTIYLTY
jgi:succinate-semialdehyde dehydrogenase / glutarate-semialdehyde dehydrogenase